MKIPLKVRYIIMSFSQFKKDINFLSQYKDKFVEFKLKLEFNTVVPKEEKLVKGKKKNLQELITQYINKIEDKDVKELLKKLLEE